MGLIEKILDAIKLTDRYEDEEEFDEYGDDDYDEQREEEERDRRKRSRKDRDPDESDGSEPDLVVKSTRKSNVVPISRNAKGVMEVRVIKPVVFEDSKDIVDTLLKGRAVVVNLEGIHIEVSQRITDFISGACYSIDGKLNKVTEYILLISPSSIELSGDLLDVLSDKKFDMSTNLHL